MSMDDDDHLPTSVSLACLALTLHEKRIRQGTCNLIYTDENTFLANVVFLIKRLRKRMKFTILIPMCLKVCLLRNYSVINIEPSSMVFFFEKELQ